VCAANEGPLRALMSYTKKKKKGGEREGKEYRIRDVTQIKLIKITKKKNE